MHERTTLCGHPTEVDRPRRQVEPVDDPVVVRQQDRVSRPVTLLQHTLLLLVQRLQRRQRHHGWRPTIGLARCLDVTINGVGERVVTALTDDLLARLGDVVRHVEHAVLGDLLLVVAVFLLTRLHAMQERERLVPVLLVRHRLLNVFGQHVLPEPLRRLTRRQLEPPNGRVDDALVVLHEEDLCQVDGLVAQALSVTPVERINEHDARAEGTKAHAHLVVLASEVRLRLVAVAEENLVHLLEPQLGVPVAPHVRV